MRRWKKDWFQEDEDNLGWEDWPTCVREEGEQLAEPVTAPGGGGEASADAAAESATPQAGEQQARSVSRQQYSKATAYAVGPKQ